tara:strand:+ start:1696 stop:2559 length:864 start_codon:yes stop_codon:yes gene_type:complete
MRKIRLNKEIFGARESRDYLDEEFSEIKIKKYTVEEFFEFYDELFYDIEKEGHLSHSTIIAKSTEYVGTPPNPKDQEIIDLKEQVRDIQFEIDSIEEEHPFLPNRTVIQVRNQPALRYYMQSGRRRQIKNDEILKSIRQQTRTADGIPNEDYCVLLDAEAILSILPGPDVEVEADLTVNTALINRYNPALSSKSNGQLQAADIRADIEQGMRLEKPDLKNTSIVPEMSQYNPLANIEEPGLPPGGLDFTTLINNTNSFNENQESLDNWQGRNQNYNTRTVNDGTTLL